MPLSPVRDLVYQSNRLVRLLRAAVMQEYAHLGLSPRQAAALGLLVQNEQMTMGELADGIGIDRPTLTGVVDRLIRAEWVNVAVNKQDHRSRIVTLSDKGRAAAEDVVETGKRATEKALIGLTPEEAHTLTELLVRAGDALEAASADG